MSERAELAEQWPAFAERIGDMGERILDLAGDDAL